MKNQERQGTEKGSSPPKSKEVFVEDKQEDQQTKKQESSSPPRILYVFAGLLGLLFFIMMVGGKNLLIEIQRSGDLIAWGGGIILFVAVIILIIAGIISSISAEKEEQVKAQEANVIKAAQRYKQTDQEITKAEEEAKEIDKQNIERALRETQEALEGQEQGEIFVQVPDPKFPATRIISSALRYRQWDDLLFEIEKLNFVEQDKRTFKRSIRLGDGTLLNPGQAETQLRENLQEIIEQTQKSGSNKRG